jgi:predicted transport protein
MWRFSREEMARHTLDRIGEQQFTDGKVRKALQSLLANPPKRLLLLLRNTIGDDALTFPQLKASLQRTVETIFPSGAGPLPMPFPAGGSTKPDRTAGTEKAIPTKPAIGKSTYDEQYHLQGKPQQVVDLYRHLDAFCLSLHPNIRRDYTKFYIGYKYIRTFCSVRIQRRSVKVWTRLKYDEISNPPSFARDVSGIGHWGSGDTELTIRSESELPEAERLIRLAFEKAQRNG